MNRFGAWIIIKISCWKSFLVGSSDRSQACMWKSSTQRTTKRCALWLERNTQYITKPLKYIKMSNFLMKGVNLSEFTNLQRQEGKLSQWRKTSFCLTWNRLQPFARLLASGKTSWRNLLRKSSINEIKRVISILCSYHKSRKSKATENLTCAQRQWTHNQSEAVGRISKEKFESESLCKLQTKTVIISLIFYGKHKIDDPEQVHYLERCEIWEGWRNWRRL